MHVRHLTLKDFRSYPSAELALTPGVTTLVGRNGQGKSTLLKLVAGVMIADEGTVEVTGGVAPLIEITGGFVDDLTVRDNVYLTAGLHGMTSAQIDAKFDEIIGFADIGDFLDTPYKHLSSGMKVRIAFAVISQLDEPILLVDEVLAVGDKAFREKCYRRIDEMLAGGRTLFFVSHNERDLRRFCTRGLYLNKGALVLDAEGNEVGRVTSGGFSPSLQRPIAMGYVASHLAEAGTGLKLEQRSKLFDARVAAMPFVPHRYKRKGATQ